MTVTAKDLRFNVSMLFEQLNKGEDILITYRGKARAKLVPYKNTTSEPKSDLIFGMWSDKNESVDKIIRDLRKGRNFDI